MIEKLLSDSRIDSRNVIEALSTLGVDDWENVIPGDIDPEDLDDVNWAVEALEEMEAASADRAHDGIFLIAKHDWESYVQEFAEDCGMLDRNSGWPHDCIDWALAAHELAYDYTTVTIGGIEYYTR